MDALDRKFAVCPADLLVPMGGLRNALPRLRTVIYRTFVTERLLSMDEQWSTGLGVSKPWLSI